MFLVGFEKLNFMELIIWEIVKMIFLVGRFFGEIIRVKWKDEGGEMRNLGYIYVFKIWCFILFVSRDCYIFVM